MEAGGLLPRQPQQGPPGPGSVCATVQGGSSGSSQNSPAHELSQLGQVAGSQQQQLQLQQQMGQAPGISDVPAKNPVTFDRLRRRINGYRKHSSECIPRHTQSFNGIVEQNIQETLVLKQRFVENNKTKRQAKKTEKKQNEPVGLAGIHVVSVRNCTL